MGRVSLQPIGADRAHADLARHCPPRPLLAKRCDNDLGVGDGTGAAEMELVVAEIVGIGPGDRVPIEERCSYRMTLDTFGESPVDSALPVSRCLDREEHEPLNCTARVDEIVESTIIEKPVGAKVHDDDLGQRTGAESLSKNGRCVDELPTWNRVNLDSRPRIWQR